MNEPGDALSIEAVIAQARESLRQGCTSRSKSGERMQNQNEEWEQLCQLAAVEKDPERLMRLVGRIVELLDARRASSKGPGVNGVPPVKPNTESSSV
jgi:hypothetical protein